MKNVRQNLTTGQNALEESVSVQAEQKHECSPTIKPSYGFYPELWIRYNFFKIRIVSGCVFNFVSRPGTFWNISYPGPDPDLVSGADLDNKIKKQHYRT